MTKSAALVFGAVFMLIGILGFVPGTAPNGMLLGLFHVNAAHNVVHLLTGAIALGVGMTSVPASRLFFQVFGIVYGLVAVLGFVYGERPILGLIANNMADTWLHVLIPAVSLFLGFATSPTTVVGHEPTARPLTR
jgi:Domain of unknown function (DUF4383)